MMATQFPGFQDVHCAFVAEQPLFFVATAAAAGSVNVSPKGMDSLRILGPNRLIWRNLTGSGNETAGHLGQVNRMTVMWCSFGPKPLILRAYGTARTLHANDDGFAGHDAGFPPDPGARQIFDMTVDMVQSSCGYAVPEMDLKAERRILANWSDAQGPDAIRRHWSERNARTIDGFPTGTGT
jgi:hypothetical protein